MRSKQTFFGGLALLAAGTTAGFVASNMTVTWKGSAQASPVVIADKVLPPPSAAQVADARQFSRTFAQVASQLSPSVVSIEVTKSAKLQRGNPMAGTPFERFFGEQPDEEGGGGRGPKQHAAGSGVVIDNKGYILTNNHVVEDTDSVKVKFEDGKVVTGKVVGTDPKTDLAVVKVDGVVVKAARLGDSDKLQVGDWVIAIGNPFGLDHTVTVGVLSAKNRSGFGKNQYEDFLQTDASINPGNSGGPLVSLDGEVIGINTMIAGIGTGIGFSVPSSMARTIADQLIHGGKVRRPFLGIQMQTVTPEMQRTLGANAPDRGAIVAQIVPDSPAAKAGLRDRDVITSIDGKNVDGSQAVQRTVLTKSIGQKVNLALWRDGKSLTLNVTTAEMPTEGALAQANNGGGNGGGDVRTKLGIQYQNLTPDIAQQLDLGANMKGAVITNLEEGAPAAEAGLQRGDVIVEVDRKPITSAADLGRELSQNRGNGHLVRVRRGNAALFFAIP
jgi:serine protease Do